MFDGLTDWLGTGGITALVGGLAGLIGAIITFWDKIAALRQRLFRRSRLCDPNAFDLPLVPDRTAVYAEKVEHIKEFLVGRKEHTEELKKLIVESPLVFVGGSSGVGKSTLLKLGTARRLHQSGVWLPIYFDLWGTDWIRGPYGALADAVQVAIDKGLSEEKRKNLVLDGAITEKNVFDVLDLLRSKCGRRPAVIFDQVDDYLVRHRDKFVDPESKRFLSAERVTATNEFWGEVAARCSDRDNPLHCVFSIRSDQAMGLECFRFVEPSPYPLEGLVRVDLDRLIANLIDEAKIDNPEDGFRQLKTQLARELKARGTTVLPIQVRVAVGGLAGLRTLTPQGLENAGGLPGLEAAYVERYAPAEDKQARALLQALVLEAGDGLKTDVKTIKQLREKVPADGRLETMLERLERGQIVRRRLEPGTGEVWQLYHDYLAHGVVERERRQRRWEIFLEEAAGTFEEAHGPWVKWRRLLAPGTLLRLLWERLRGRLSFGGRARFACISSLRLAVNVWVLLIGVGAYGWWWYDAEQRAERIVNAFDNDNGLSDAELRAVWQLSGESFRVRRRVLERLISDATGPQKLRPHFSPILHALGGLDGDRRRSLLKPALGSCEDANFRAADIVEVCRDAALTFDTDGLRTAAFLLTAMKRTENAEVLSRLGSALGGLGERLSPEAGALGAKLIVAAMEKTDSVVALSELGSGLGALGERLSPEAAARGAERIVAAMEKTADASELSWLGSALGTLGERLSAEKAARGAEQIVAAMEKTENDFALYRPSAALAALGERLSPEAAARGAERIIAAMEKTENVSVLSRLVSPLGALVERTSPEAAARGAQRIVAAMEESRNDFALSALGSALGALGERLIAETAVRGASRLVLAMEKTESVSVLSRLGSALGALGEQLGPEATARGAERIVAVMDQTENAEAIYRLGSGLGRLGDRLSAATVARAAERIVAVMEKTENLAALERLAGGLRPLGERLSAKTAARAAERIVEAMGKPRSPQVLYGLGAALAAIGPSLNEEAAGTALAALIVRIRVLDDTRIFSYCYTAVALAREATLPRLIDLLKWPTFSDEDRAVVMERVGRLHRTDPEEFGWYEERDNGARRFRVHLGEFIAWAEEQAYADGTPFDLTTPPENPFRK